MSNSKEAPQIISEYLYSLYQLVKHLIDDLPISHFQQPDKERYWKLVEKVQSDIDYIHRIYLSLFEELKEVQKGTVTPEVFQGILIEEMNKLRVIKTSLITQQRVVTSLKLRYSRTATLERLDHMYNTQIVSIDHILKEPDYYFSLLQGRPLNLAQLNLSSIDDAIRRHISLIQHKIQSLRDKLPDIDPHSMNVHVISILRDIDQTISDLREFQTALVMHAPHEQTKILQQLPTQLSILKFLITQLPKKDIV